MCTFGVLGNKKAPSSCEKGVNGCFIICLIKYFLYLCVAIRERLQGDFSYPKSGNVTPQSNMYETYNFIQGLGLKI